MAAGTIGPMAGRRSAQPIVKLFRIRASVRGRRLVRNRNYYPGGFPVEAPKRREMLSDNSRGGGSGTAPGEAADRVSDQMRGFAPATYTYTRAPP
jgi:hypothetical protein